MKGGQQFLRRPFNRLVINSLWRIMGVYITRPPASHLCSSGRCVEQLCINTSLLHSNNGPEQKTPLLYTPQKFKNWPIANPRARVSGSPKSSVRANSGALSVTNSQALRRLKLKDHSVHDRCRHVVCASLSFFRCNRTADSSAI